MNKQLHRLDLNLLVILQYLMEEHSVSLAAKRLAITPSSIPFLMPWRKRNTYNSKTLWLKEQIKNRIFAFVEP